MPTASLTVEHTLAVGGVSALLLLVRAFCWCWRHRSQRKTTLAVLDSLRDREPRSDPTEPS
jgi:hypothetical protein